MPFSKTTTARLVVFVVAFLVTLWLIPNFLHFAINVALAVIIAGHIAFIDQVSFYLGFGGNGDSASNTFFRDDE